jgi:very-short-patch-repair endonuclease
MSNPGRPRREAETILWRALRNRRLDGYGFRRQTPIGALFRGFRLSGKEIVLEADDRSHDSAEAKRKDGEKMRGSGARDFAS